MHFIQLWIFVTLILVFRCSKNLIYFLWCLKYFLFAFCFSVLFLFQTQKLHAFGWQWMHNNINITAQTHTELSQTVIKLTWIQFLLFFLSFLFGRFMFGNRVCFSYEPMFAAKLAQVETIKYTLFKCCSAFCCFIFFSCLRFHTKCEMDLLQFFFKNIPNGRTNSWTNRSTARSGDDWNDFTISTGWRRTTARNRGSGGMLFSSSSCFDSML